MRGIYSNFNNDELWLIKETKWAKPLQGIREAQFALGNGYIGTRGILEELPYDAMPGTYIAGVYDKTAAQVAELVNLPNPVNFRLSLEGEKIDIVAMDYLEHKRILNMKKGILLRRTLYRDSKKRSYEYQSLRFISMHDKNIGVMQIAFTPQNAPCTLNINTGIDTSVSNTGMLSEGRKRHFRVRELGQHKNAGYLLAETLEKKYTIAFWSGFYYETNGRKTFAKDNIFSLKIKKGQTVVFTKVFCIKHFPYKEEPASYKKETYAIFSRAFRSKFSALLRDHVQAWGRLWKKADIVIEGTANIQQNVRFSIYHLLICGHYDNGFSSVGARTLSGEGYHGHIFWDAEIFVFPFYLFTFPHIAKNFLLYRYKRISQARALAKQEGFQGAKFPWESADTGLEETPEWARDIDRRIIKIHTHKQEHHITCDIAYAVYKYYVATGDEKFMDTCGYELLLATARFWASRVERGKKGKSYEIRNVIGPDEFHVGVNNNAYTNLMAKWNLITAYKLYNKIKERAALHKRLKGKLTLTDKEVRKWLEIASGIKVSIRKDKVIEQCDGYFKLKNVPLERTDENGIPLMPERVKPSEFQKTQLVKQADVLMLMVLLDDVFSPATKKANYEYYIARTLHKSSLSAATHSHLACELNDLNRAYSFFNVSLRTDVSNLYGNTYEGIHAAALGGTWQALVFGFAGVQIKKEKLCIDPRMPRTWKKIIFSLMWRSALVKLAVSNETIQIKISASKIKYLEVGIFDKLVSLKTGKTYTFARKTPGYITEYYY